MKQLVLALDTSPSLPVVVDACCHKTALQSAPPCLTPDHTNDPTHIESEQLKRLARAILAKDHRDLTALATCNPSLIAEWQEAFRQQHIEAEQHARYWASAAAVLATANGLAECRPEHQHTAK